METGLCIVCGKETVETVCSRCLEAMQRNYQPQAIFIDGLGKETSCHLEKMVETGTEFRCRRFYPTTSFGASRWLVGSDPRLESVEQALQHRYSNEKTIYINSPVYTLFFAPKDMRHLLVDRLVRPSVWVLSVLQCDAVNVLESQMAQLVEQAGRMGTAVYRYCYDPKVMLHKAERAAVNGSVVAVVDGYRRTNAKKMLGAALRLYERVSRC